MKNDEHNQTIYIVDRKTGKVQEITISSESYIVPGGIIPLWRELQDDFDRNCDKQRGPKFKMQLKYNDLLLGSFPAIETDGFINFLDEKEAT